MTEFMTPVFGKPWASVVPAALRAADRGTGLPVGPRVERRHADLLDGSYAGGPTTGGGRGSDALIPNQPVTGSLPARRQVLTS